MKKLPLDTTIQEYDIYLLLDPASLEYYVWRVKSGNTYDAYYKHVSQQFAKTTDWFVRCGSENNYPVMYRLETIIATKEVSFRHCIAWTKYFAEHGYISLSAEYFLAYCNDMTPETAAIYDSIRDIPLDTTLCQENILVENYKKRSDNKRKTKPQITVYVAQKQFDQITSRAEDVGLSTSSYCKNMALDGHIYTLDSPQIFEALAELRVSNAILRQVLTSMADSAKGYPDDMAAIQAAVDDIMQCSREIIDIYRMNTRYLKELLPK